MDEVKLPKLTQIERVLSSTPVLIPLAILRVLRRAVFSRYITLRMWLIDEELIRVRDRALAADDFFDDEEKLEKLRARPRIQRLLFERERLYHLIYRLGEVSGLRMDRGLRRQALRFGVVSLPTGQHDYVPSKITGDPRLSAHGVAKVRKDIRAEKRDRREPWKDRVLWFTAIGGLLSGLAALLALLLRTT